MFRKGWARCAPRNEIYTANSSTLLYFTRRTSSRRKAGPKDLSLSLSLSSSLSLSVLWPHLRLAALAYASLSLLDTYFDGYCTYFGFLFQPAWACSTT